MGSGEQEAYKEAHLVIGPPMLRTANSAKKKRAKQAALYEKGQLAYDELLKFTRYPHSYKPKKPERAAIKQRMASAFQASGYLLDRLAEKSKRKLRLAIAKAAELAKIPEYATDFSSKSEAFYLYIPRSKNDWTCIRFANHGIYYKSSGFCMQASLRDMPKHFPSQVLFIADVMLEAIERGPDVPHPEVIKRARAYGKANWRKFKFRDWRLRNEDSVQDIMHANAVRLHHADLRQRGITPIRGPVTSKTFGGWVNA